jgi:riboflavin synthase
MFSGIIEEVGIIKKKTQSFDISVMDVKAEKITEDTKEGDSISVNGVCLTAEKKKDNILTFSATKQTLKETNLGKLKTGDSVNLERALKAGDRIGGHLLSGHIDFTTVLLSLVKRSNSAVLELKVPEKYKKYVVEKGSIAVEGISLTIGEIKNNLIKIYLIPYTLNNTTLKNKKPGCLLNIELDMIGKYAVSNFTYRVPETRLVKD